MSPSFFFLSKTCEPPRHYITEFESHRLWLFYIFAGINASWETIVKEMHLVLIDSKYISDVSIWLALRQVEQWLSSFCVKFLIVYLHFKTWQNLQIIPKKAWWKFLYRRTTLILVPLVGRYDMLVLEYFLFESDATLRY